MPDVHAKDGSVHIAISGDPDELTPSEALQIAGDLIAAAHQAEQQQRANWALCEAEGHDWSQWFNGHNPFRNHYRHCRRPGCLDPHEQYPGWMPFAGRPHAGMFGPRQCYGPGCDHCEAEQFGTVVRGFLREAADALAAEFLGEPNRCPECQLLSAHKPLCSRPVPMPWEIPHIDPAYNNPEVS